jgi:hypothetical protein
VPYLIFFASFLAYTSFIYDGEEPTLLNYILAGISIMFSLYSLFLEARQLIL